MMYELPANGPAGQARDAALANARRVEVEPTSLVSYLSRGRLLVIGDESTALAAAAETDASLIRTVFIPAGDRQPEVSNEAGLMVIRGGEAALSGSLGAFSLELSAGGDPVSLNELLGKKDVGFDMVLDLGEAPMLTAELLPPGYLAPADDPAALAAAIEALPGMTGEFEKPKYFNYNPDICAHDRSGDVAQWTLHPRRHLSLPEGPDEGEAGEIGTDADDDHCQPHR